MGTGGAMGMSRAEAGRLGGIATARAHDMRALGQRGGRALVDSRPEGYMRQLGARGFHATCQRRFGGNVEAMKEWFTAKGQAAQDPFPANGAFPDPGPMPIYCARCDALTTSDICPGCNKPPCPF